MSYDPELFQLLSGYFAGTLSPAESERLLELAKTDPQVLREIAELVAVERAVAWSYSESESGLFAREVVHRLQPQKPDRFVQQVIEGVSTLQARQTRWWKHWVPLAAAALVMVGFAWALFGVWPNRSKNSGEQAVTMPLKHVAVVTASESAKWDPSGPSPILGSALAPGQLKLIKGRVEIDFAIGAKIVVRAPAEFAVLSSSRAKLFRGDLGASVPKGAEGFVVDTPSVEVVDLGTEFGVKVGNNGVADVRVFKGKVEARVNSSQGDGALVQLEMDMARRFDPVRGLSNEPGLAKEAFPRVAELPTDSPTTKGALHLLNRPPATMSGLQSDDFMLLFAERKSAMVPSGQRANIVKAGSYSQPGKLSEVMVATGRRVDSYLLHFDAFPTSTARDARGSGVQLDGAVTFPRPVVAMMAVANTLQQTDRHFGVSDTRYVQNSYRGLEMHEFDRITLSEDRKTVSVSLFVHGTVGLDEVRILVESEP